LVSSSGWAHSPITLILSGLSIELPVGGAALPGIATVIAIAPAVSIAPVNTARRRFIDRTSDPPSRERRKIWGQPRMVRVAPPRRPLAPNRATSNTGTRRPYDPPPLPVKQHPPPPGWRDARSSGR